MNTGRIYNRGEKPHNVFSQYHGPNKFNRYFYVRIGRVLELDYDRYRMRIEWTQGSGSPAWMPISFAYAGPGGCLGMIPEEGAIGIFSFYDEGDGKGSPLACAFLPASLSAGLEFNSVKIDPDSVSNEDDNILNFRFRPLLAGDMIMASPLGGQLFVNKHIEITDNSQDYILLRSSDQSIIQNSLNNFLFADGASVCAGPIIRNQLSIFDQDGKRLENTNGREMSFPEGRDAIFIVPFGNPIEYDTKFYSEYRVDVDEICDRVIDENDITGYTSTSTRDPIVTMAMGNYVGANDSDSRYGLILRPVMFSSRLDKDGSFDLIQCSQLKGVDEVSNLGLAYALHFLKSGAFMGFDKQGHYHLYLPASTNNPLGAGRSMSVLADGNKKEIWGRSSDDGNSWDLTLKGGLRWDVGSHNNIEKNRSIDIRTDSGVYIEAGDEDDDGYARQDKSFGDTLEYVGGTKFIEISGGYNAVITGIKTETIAGSASEVVSVDKSVNVLGIYNEQVTKEKQCQFGKRKTSISGDDELTITKGDLIQTIQVFGNKKTSIQGSGSIEETITAGNKKISITAGNYELKISAGQITIKTSAGSVEVNGTTLDLKGTASASLKAIKVDIGNGPRGGIVTGLPGTPSHNDYVTGAPLKGCITVKAGA